MSYQLATAKVWNGAAWVAAAGGSKPWWQTYGQVQRGLATAVNVTCGSTAHTKGAWTEMVASTSGNADLLVIGANASANSTDTSTLFDVGFGSSGSEVVKISDVAIGSWSYLAVPIPFAVPSGTRIAIRAQSVVAAGKVVPFYVQVFDTGSYSSAPTVVDTLGTSTATSRGVSLSSTANAYAQVIASTSSAYKAIIVVPSAADASLSGYNETYTLATGAAGSEVDIGSLTVNSTANEIVQPFGMQSLGIMSGSFASGIRLSVKGNQSITGSTFEVCLIGVR